MSIMKHSNALLLALSHNQHLVLFQFCGFLKEVGAIAIATELSKPIKKRRKKKEEERKENCYFNFGSIKDTA